MSREFIDKVLKVQERLTAFAEKSLPREFSDVTLESTEYNDSGDIIVRVKVNKSKEEQVADKLMEETNPKTWVTGRGYITPQVRVVTLDDITSGPSASNDEYIDQYFDQKAVSEESKA